MFAKFILRLPLAALFVLGVSVATTNLNPVLFPSAISTAHAASKEERAMAKVVKNLDRHSSKLAGYEDGKRFRESNLKSLGKQLGRLSRDIEKLGSAGISVDAVKAQLGVLEERLSNLQEKLKMNASADNKQTDRQAQKEAKRAEQAADRTSGILDKITKELDRIEWEFVSHDRSVERLEKSLAKAESNLANIPEDAEVRAPVSAQYEEVANKVAQARTRIDQLMGGLGDARERVEVAIRSGQMEEDNRSITQMRTVAYSVIEHVENDELRFWSSDDTDKYVEWAATIDDMYKQATEILARYEGIPRSELNSVADSLHAELGAQTQQIGNIGGLLNNGLGEIQTAYDLFDGLRKNGVEKVNARLAAANDFAQPLIAALDYDNLITSDEVAGALTYGENVLKVVSAFPNGASYLADVSSAHEAGKAIIDAKVKDVYDAIVEQNTPATHNYGGNDSKQLLALAVREFKSYHKKQDVIGGVVKSEDWYRETKEEIRNKALVKIDRSSVTIYIFVREPNVLASAWSVDITKNHLQGDSMSGHVYQKARTTPVHPSRVFLESKVAVFN